MLGLIESAPCCRLRGLPIPDIYLHNSSEGVGAGVGAREGERVGAGVGETVGDGVQPQAKSITAMRPVAEVTASDTKSVVLACVIPTMTPTSS